MAPGKRPRLTPNPAIVVRDDGSVMPFGAPGGDVQVQAMLQVLLNTFHFGMDIQEAIEQPRVASYRFPSSFAPFDYFPGRLAVEGRIDPAVRDDLAGRGHEVKSWPEWTWLAGSVEAVLRDPVSGLVAAGADPRRPAYADRDLRQASRTQSCTKCTQSFTEKEMRRGAQLADPAATKLL